MTLKDLDALNLVQIVADDPVDFTWSGSTYRATCTQRTTSKDLDSGGFLADFDSAILVPVSVFSIGYPTENQKVGLFCDNAGIPCIEGTTGSAELSHRIVRVGRAGGGLHLFLIANSK